MKARSLISIAVAAATLAVSTASLAGDDHRRHWRDGGRHDGPRAERHVERHVYDRGPRHMDRHFHGHGPRHGQRDVYIVNRPGPPHYGQHYGAQYGPHYGPRWQRGQYLPREYRGGRYIVVQHNPRLYQPPRGHHWVQVNGEFLLVAAATGLIAHAILSH